MTANKLTWASPFGGAPRSGTAGPCEVSAQRHFEELDLADLDSVIGGNGGSRGGGTPANPNVGNGFQASFSLGPFSGGVTITDKGSTFNGAFGASWGAELSAEHVTVIPNPGSTVQDVLDGASIGGSAGYGVTGSYSTNSSGSVYGFGIGAGVSAGVSYGVDPHGGITDGENAIHSNQDAALVQLGIDHGLNDPGTYADPATYAAYVRTVDPAAAAASDNAIQSQADGNAILAGLNSGRITDDDVSSLGHEGAAAIVRADDYTANDPSALDDHGFHDGSPSPDGHDPNAPSDNSSGDPTPAAHDGSQDPHASDPGDPGAAAAPPSDNSSGDPTPSAHDGSQDQHASDPSAAAAAPSDNSSGDPTPSAHDGSAGNPAGDNGGVQGGFDTGGGEGGGDFGGDDA